MLPSTWNLRHFCTELLNMRGSHPEADQSSSDLPIDPPTQPQTPPPPPTHTHTSDTCPRARAHTHTPQYLRLPHDQSTNSTKDRRTFLCPHQSTSGQTHRHAITICSSPHRGTRAKQAGRVEASSLRPSPQPACYKPLAHPCQYRLRLWACCSRISGLIHPRDVHDISFARPQLKMELSDKTWC